MAGLTITSKTVKDGNGASVTTEMYADPNNASNVGPIVSLIDAANGNLLGSTNPVPTTASQTSADGTPITWLASGGTYGLTLTSVANAGARQGAKGDLGAVRQRKYNVQMQIQLAVAGTAGNTVDLYWAESNSATAGTNNPGNTTGTDAAYTPSDYLPQLQYVGSLVVSNAAGTGIQIANVGPFSPRFRYGMPVIVNNSGQALGATAGNFSLSFTPQTDVG